MRVFLCNTRDDMDSKTSWGRLEMKHNHNHKINISSNKNKSESESDSDSDSDSDSNNTINRRGQSPKLTS